jgi:hypothetical protein
MDRKIVIHVMTPPPNLLTKFRYNNYQAISRKRRESPKSILSLSKSNNRPLVKLFCGTGRKVIRFESTPSETDILNRLEKAFNKVTIRTKETKEKCRKLDIQTVVQENFSLVSFVRIVTLLKAFSNLFKMSVSEGVLWLSLFPCTEHVLAGYLL